MWSTSRMSPFLNGFGRASSLGGWLRLAALVVLVVLAIGPAVLGDEIHAAAQDGDLPKVRRLIRADPNLVSSPGAFGAKPLHLAAAFGYQDLVEFLLASQADIEAKTVAGKTPLHWAASEGRTNVVWFLLAHHAQVNARDKYGNTPLHDAALNGRKEVVELLLRNSAEVNVTNAWGWSPLHFAVVAGDREAVELLLHHQANINGKGFSGNTPLRYANDEKMAGWLRQQGAVE